jgi:O-antigen ligase
MAVLVWIFLLSLLGGQFVRLVVPESSLYLHDVVLGVLVIFSVIRIALKRSVVLPKRTAPIVAFAGAAALSLIAAAHNFSPAEVTTGSLYLVRWAAYAAIYAVVVQAFVPSAVWVWGLFWAGAGVAAAGFAQYALYPDLRNLLYLGWDPHYYRLVSVLFDPNFAGIVLVLAVLLSLHLWRMTKQPWLLFAAMGEAVAVILTYSRSSYLALVIGAVMYISSIKRRARAALWTVLILLLIFVYIPKPGGDTLRLDRMASTTSRIENWAYSTDLFLRSPVTGLGFNTLRYVGLRDEVWEESAGAESRAGAGIDNSILFVAASTGVIGFAAYAWLLICLFRVVSLKSRTREGAANVFHAMLVAALVDSMFVNSLFYPWVMVWVWVMAGVAESEEGKETVYRW